MKTTKLSLLACALVFGVNASLAYADAGPTSNFCAYDGYTLNGQEDPSVKATCKFIENSARFYLAPELAGEIDLISSEDYTYLGSQYLSEADQIPNYRVYQIGQDIGSSFLFAVPHSVFAKYFSNPSILGIGVGATMKNSLKVTATTTYFNLAGSKDHEDSQTTYGSPLGTVYGLVVSGLKFATSSPKGNEHLAIYNSGRGNGYFDSSVSQISRETVSIASPVAGYDGTYTISQNKQGLLEIHQDSITTRFEDDSKKTENFNSAKTDAVTPTATSQATRTTVTVAPATTTVTSAPTVVEPVSKSWVKSLWDWFRGLFS
jgi:hypothetical protein